MILWFWLPFVKNADELILSVVMQNKCNLLIMYYPVNMYE